MSLRSLWNALVGPATPRICPGCEARDRHIDFLQMEVRNMREQVVGMAERVFVSSPEPTPMTESEIPQDPDETAAAQEESERQSEIAQEIQALTTRTGKPPGFFADVP